ncbi:M15 family metallopeptidase [Cellulosimicrobium marinum]|uniref:M15 family metallopeptidase n=1 Tax=Cellulosimicrobium marinum TaxID=1638992 RepID=UPI001E44D2E6|nr:M15 family metallopeptidase [Cellulosimicrobium marinum]MCB7135974.1 M15 family metallopeptidase [Cellulosimicrobium marinum]
MSTDTHSEDADDRAPSRAARVVSHVLISSALAISLAAALVGSTESRPGDSFFATPTTRATAAEPVSAELSPLDEQRRLDGAIEILATANALESGAVSPSIEQTRSELGVLVATYLAQQDAARRVPVQLVPEEDVELDDTLDEAEVPQLPDVPDPFAPPDLRPEGSQDEPQREGPRDPVEDSGVVPDDVEQVTLASARPAAATPEPSSTPTPTPTPSGTMPSAPRAVTGDDADEPTGGTTAPPAVTPGTSGDRVLPEDDVPAPDGIAPGELGSAPGEPQTPDDDGARDASAPGTEAGVGGEVTLDDVVVVATRLADLLDMSTAFPSVGVGVVPADGVEPAPGTTLAERLAQVVEKYADSTADYENGRIPADVLCDLSFAPGQSLRCDAAEQLEALAAEFEKEFGHALPITDSYRSYEDQVRLKAMKPYLAAVPGTSQHGWGLAIDVGGSVPSGRSAEYVWMRLHAPDYGWDNPAWARPGGVKPEPWHFEFFGAGEMPTRYTPAEDLTPGTTTPNPNPTPKPTPKPTPTDPPTKPTDPPTKPTDPPTKPTDPPTKPTDPPTKPTDPPTKPTDPPTKPTDPPTDPTDPTDPPTDPTDPTDPPTDPTDPPTDPTDPPTDEPTEEPTAKPTSTPTETAAEKTMPTDDATSGTTPGE